MKPLLKICGMKHNIAEVAVLQPDYLGFIFYDKSPRYFDGDIPSLPSGIKKVGVFVDEKISKIIELCKKYSLDVIQLHGSESKEYVLDLQGYLALYYPDALKFGRFLTLTMSSISANLKIFENKVDKFLFDTKGKEKGGNGYTFDWEILKKYPSNKPFILSGGIGLDEVAAIKELLKTDLPIYTIDINSKFEIEPGLKNIDDLKKIKNEL